MKIVGARWTPRYNVMLILCDDCGQRFEIPAAWVDMNVVKCPYCGATADGTAMCAAGVFLPEI